jgi:nitrogen fixation-related uncharacterized protein
MEAEAALAVYKRLAPLLCLALIPLAIALVVQKLETHHWKKQSGQFEQLYHGEQTAHAVTVVNYRAAADQARAADKANADRVIAEQRQINERTSDDYEARIADARARAGRLSAELAKAAANPGGGGGTPVPGVPAAAGGADQAAGQDRLPPPDALIATEQAIQLDELIKWVRRQSSVNVNHPVGDDRDNR